MKRSTLMLSFLIAMVILSTSYVAEASWVSHGVNELDKLVRGETYVMQYPGMLVQVTEYLPAGTTLPALNVRPHPEQAYVLRGVVCEVRITFLTGDYEGRPGQVIFSGAPDGIVVDNPCIAGARDYGGMALVTTFPKDTKQIRFVWHTANYEPGAYTFLVEAFPRSKRQMYSETAIPVFLAASFDEVQPSLQNADDETLKRYGLRWLSEVLESRQTPAWTGDVYLTDGARLHSVSLPRTPEVGMAIAIVDGYTVVGGGIVKSVNETACSTEMSSQVLRGYESRIGELTAKLAYFSPVRGKMRALTAEEERWVQGFPNIVGGNPKNRLRDAVRELIAMDVCHIGPRQPSPHYWALMQAVTVNKGVWIPVDIQQEVAERISVIGWDYTSRPVLDLKELARETVRRPGIFSVVWQLNPIRNTNTQSQTQGQGQSQSQQQQQEQQQQQNQDQDTTINIDP